MAKRSKEMFMFYLCVYIRQSSRVRLTVKTLEVSNTISELDGQCPLLRKDLYSIRLIGAFGLHSRRLTSKTDCNQLDQKGLQICTAALLV